MEVKMRTDKAEVLTIKEDFMQVANKILDSKNRLNLGNKIKKLLTGKIKVDSFRIFIGKEGDILLRPSTHIPSKELWLYENRSAYSKVAEGLKQAKTGKTETVKDLDKFLQDL